MTAFSSTVHVSSKDTLLIVGCFVALTAGVAAFTGAAATGVQALSTDNLFSVVGVDITGVHTFSMDTLLLLIEERATSTTGVPATIGVPTADCVRAVSTDARIGSSAGEFIVGVHVGSIPEVRIGGGGFARAVFGADASGSKKSRLLKPAPKESCRGVGFGSAGGADKGANVVLESTVGDETISPQSSSSSSTSSGSGSASALPSATTSVVGGTGGGGMSSIEVARSSCSSLSHGDLGISAGESGGGGRSADPALA